MRCKKHYTDLSSTVGVCSCCLRERLISIIAAQEQEKALNKRYNSENIPATHHRKRNQSDGADINSDKTDNNNNNNNLWNNNPQLRPRSVPHHRRIISDQLFYHTPEVDTTTTTSGGGDLSKKWSFSRVFSFMNIFRSRNRKPVDSVMVTVMDSRVSNSSVRRYRDRGMSPVRDSDAGACDEDESNNATSEYESTGSWKNTPRRTPARGGHVRNLSGITFCLSPLVRASPNRPEVVFSGDIRAPVKPHLSNTKSFHANRSRKLADFGRTNLNR
ncbi:hypothetical protein M8C21_027005 [Ambrosia artemisiifolia]|uniref:Uncharacterized protein n=1 Tax=Ambrosia artemisiifolia TaxID=4212 RepID=A0AAD5C083_AMBAR|nr:hypothetical protein M8C21_027005 [Ambrosia artemisiifolia]